MKTRWKRMLFGLIALLVCGGWLGFAASAAPLPGGTLDPTTIPKYVTPLVIPPVMPTDGLANSYDIAVRQFRQQILPAGYGSTTVWSYGSAADPTPLVAPSPGSSFNYPAFTIETTADVPVDVRWNNELVMDPEACRTSLDPANDPACNYLPHLFPVDQTLHWANPAKETCLDGSNRTDCRTDIPDLYTGPVPMVTHVHGAHVDMESDGYPESWWLPAANNIPAGYATSGTVFMDTNNPPGSVNTTGYVDYNYRNDQPASTIWYHDHSLGITRLNVYAGPAGFWLIRGDHNDQRTGTVIADGATDGVTGQAAVLPGPAPTAADTLTQLNTPGDPVRSAIREIPIVIQDRSFNMDGELFYPDTRAFFDGFTGPYIGTTEPNSFSDISPIWNPEAFFNTMVVNGTTWPKIEVAPAQYRFRLLNGCNSRFLNLALFEAHPAKPNKTKGRELAFFQIGAEQGALPQVVEILTGFATPLPGDGTRPLDRLRAANGQQAFLLGPAERADVIVDFSKLKNGTVIRMINTAPDAPFGGFPDIPADPGTTGQVMEFVINSALLGASPTDLTATPVLNLVPNAEAPLPAPNVPPRKVTLNEEESVQVCVDPITLAPIFTRAHPADQQELNQFLADCAAAGGVPMAPKAALLGTLDTAAPATVPELWADAITENPQVGDFEPWEIYNLTVDSHPIHLHLVRFEVVSRQLFDPVTFAPVAGTLRGPEPWETGFKDTVIAYPGEITTILSHFDLEGLYVWHCHILEHEDNEMMRPYYVGDLANSPVP